MVVIGAGAAGLAAARSLARRSARVVLLEARDRAGGRVWSRPVAGSETPAELGAEFIHGRGELTRRLLHEAGLSAVDVDGDEWICAGTGDLQRDDQGILGAAVILEQARSLAADESVEQFLRRFGRDADAVRAARHFVEGFDAADPAIASARAIADELRSGTDSAAARPLGGYGPLVEHLHDVCIAAGVRLRLATAVRRISWRRGAADVEASGGGTPQTIRARAAILTLPVGVLRDRRDDTAVMFDPGLPPAKLDALRRIEMGHVVRVVLRFQTAFWERVRSGRYRDAAFFRCEGHAFQAYWTQLPVHGTLVVAWAGGPKAVALGGTTRDALIERARDGFGRLFQEPGLARAECEGGFVHDWSRDPFARGAYSYLAVGGGGAREALAAPVEDTLFFAGEATSSNGQAGTVNGALETGERAAAEAARSLSLAP